MTSNTLDELGRTVLESIADGRGTVDALETRFGAPRDELEERLAHLVENGLARPAEEGYELTENGRRVLRATPRGRKDERIDTPARVERIDTPARVERVIEGEDLRPDEAEAVRNAFSFLRYWGDATTAEILDASYSETPAGYDAPERWWGECVRNRLAALPDVERTDREPIGGNEGIRRTDDETWTCEWWAYDGTATVDRDDGVDGRAVRNPPSAPSAVGSVRHGFERLDLAREERTVARIAFAILYDRGTATASELLEAVSEECNGRTDEGWTARLSSVFGSLAGVEQGFEGNEGDFVEDEVVWSYG